jgi:hypothetical protein
MKQLRARCRMRRIMLGVAGAALVFGIPIACFIWLVYPHVKLTIFNETSAAIRDVRISFFYGERTAERIDPGGFAVTEIQSGGSTTVFLSYRDSDGVLRKDEPLYYSGEHGSVDRGFLAAHVTSEGIRLVNGIYTSFDIPSWTIHVWPRGRVTVK